MDDSILFDSILYRRPRKVRKALRLFAVAAIAFAGTALFFACPLAVPVAFFAAIAFLSL